MNPSWAIFFMWVSLACMFFAAWGHSESRVSEHCINFGKVEIKGKWYECKPL